MEKYMMLKFVLQPLVENAIKHGISEKRSTGNIRITGTISEGDLLFEVFDDGVGFDPDNMDFKENSNNNYKSGYGLKNVNERIKLEYGEEYGIRIWSRKGEGTKAYVRLKAR
jgi:two-component system sensor histidine kinase YesM